MAHIIGSVVYLHCLVFVDPIVAYQDIQPILWSEVLLIGAKTSKKMIIELSQ